MADEKSTASSTGEEKKKRNQSRQEVVAAALAGCNPFASELRLDFLTRGGHFAAMVSDLKALEFTRDYSAAMALRLAFWADAFSKLLIPKAEGVGKSKAELIATVEPEQLMKAMAAIDMMNPALRALDLVTGIRERLTKELDEKLPPPLDADDGLYQVPIISNEERERLYLKHFQKTGASALPAPALSKPETHGSQTETRPLKESAENRSSNRRSRKRT